MVDYTWVDSLGRGLEVGGLEGVDVVVDTVGRRTFG